MNIIGKLLIDRGISQKELALSIGVSEPTVSDWVNQKKNPRGANVRKLADFFNVPISTITSEIVSEVDKAISVSEANQEWSAEYPAGTALRRDMSGYKSVPRPAPQGLTDEDLKRIAEYVRAHHPEFEDGAPRTRQGRILAAGIDKLPEADRNRALMFYQLLFADHAEYFSQRTDDNEE